MFSFVVFEQFYAPVLLKTLEHFDDENEAAMAAVERLVSKEVLMRVLL